MAATKAPTGLSIARDSMKFTLSWKVADEDYGAGQEFQYRTNLDESGKWTSVSIAANVTSRTISLTAADYYPTTSDKLLRIAMRVRGKRTATTEDNVTTNYDWSAWASKVLELDVPNRPTCSQELDSSLDNKTTFTWTTETDASSKRPTVNAEWQTMLIHNCTETDGSKLNWSSSQTGWDTSTSASLSSSKAITEDSELLADGSYTRWFRVRAKGSAGDSEWRYQKHVYARPYAAEITGTGSTVTATTTTVRVEWKSQQDAAHPIDQSSVEWLIDIPIAGLNPPTGATWTEASIVADTAGADAVRIVIDDKAGIDECLWIRVNNTHDRKTNLGTPELVRTGILATPEDLTVSGVDSTNYQVDVTVTNASDVPDSKLALIFRGDGKRAIVGIISGTGEQTVSNLQCPKWGDASQIGISVYAFQGSYTSQSKTVSGVTYTVYTLTENWTSGAIGSNASIPLAPASVSVTASNLHTDAIVHWSWTWTAADIAEISWSDSIWAWGSTEQPNVYQVDDPNATKWRVRGLTPGKKYYFCVRLGKSGDEVTWSPYSEMVECGLYSTPDKPTIQLTATSVQQGGKFGVSWIYNSEDGVEQESAEVCAYPNSGVLPIESMWPKRVVARTKSAQSVNVTADGWTQGVGYFIRVRVTSKSGLVSAWSEPAVIGVPAALSINTTVTSLSNETITDSSGVSRVQVSLTGLPLTVQATPGAPTGGTTTVIIRRNEDFQQIRPDGTVGISYAGEVACIKRQSGNGQVSIKLKDLIKPLDDGCKYLLTVTASAPPQIPAEINIPFEVHWNQQAKKPSSITTELLSGNAMKVTPAVTSPLTGAVVDIYRLSADRAELIVENGEWGTAYVDPYPAIGDTAGYRAVYKTKYGDYIKDSTFAWKDKKAGLNVKDNIIDFNGEQIALKFNMGLSNSWQKGFTQTVYLGGAVQGDWDMSVKRSGSMSATAVTVKDQATIDALRRLALWTGICHIRTVDGSSYACDIQVSEVRSYKTAGNAAEFDLRITKVDSEVLDGVTYAEWTNS